MRRSGHLLYCRHRRTDRFLPSGCRMAISRRFPDRVCGRRHWRAASPRGRGVGSSSRRHCPVSCRCCRRRHVHFAGGFQLRVHVLSGHPIQSGGTHCLYWAARSPCSHAAWQQRAARLAHRALITARWPLLQRRYSRRVACAPRIWSTRVATYSLLALCAPPMARLCLRVRSRHRSSLSPYSTGRMPPGYCQSSLCSLQMRTLLW